MRPSPSIFLSIIAAIIVFPFVRAQITSSYFSISEPAFGRQWANGAVNPVKWTKGLRDGVQSFDIELARINKDGILYLARNVPATVSSFNVFLQDVPTGNDYYMIFINSTHGVMYAITPQFSIVSSTAGNGSAASPIPSAPTVTLSGPPNPTATFATTYPATNDGIPPNWVGIGGWMSSIVTIFCGITTGALLVFV